MRRFVAGAAVALGALAASTGTASAWYAHGGAYFNGSAGVVFVEAEPGEQNDITAVERLLDGKVWLHDPVNPVTRTAADRPGCALVDAHTLLCAAQWHGADTANTYLEVDLLDGDDSLVVPSTSTSVFKIVYAGTGNDTVAGRELGGAYAELGDGDDQISLRGSQGAWSLGGDYISAGEGNDVLRLFNGEDDTPFCGGGTDVLYADSGETSPDCETVHTIP